MKTTKKPVYKETWFKIVAVLSFPFLLIILILILPFLLLLSPGILLYFMWKKTNWNKKIKVAITSVFGFIIFIIVIAIIGGVLVGGGQKKEILKMVETAQNQIEEGNIEEAKKIILESKQKFNTTENPALKLEGDINKLESEVFLKKILTDMSDIEIELLKKNELKKIYIENEKINSLFLKKINENLQLRDPLLAELEKNKQLAEKRKKEQDAIKQKQELAELKIKTSQERKEKIEKQFSAWDGKHIIFSRMIQVNLKDPDSFNHVETRYEDKDGYILVAMKYRGTNSFGGIVTEYANAKFTIDGDFISLVE